MASRAAAATHAAASKSRSNWAGQRLAASRDLWTMATAPDHACALCAQDEDMLQAAKIQQRWHYLWGAIVRKLFMFYCGNTNLPVCMLPCKAQPIFSGLRQQKGPRDD